MIAELDVLISSQREARQVRTANKTRQRSYVEEYHELDEIHLQMQLLATNFPNIATYVDSIGESHDGNKIPVLRIGGSESK